MSQRLNDYFASEATEYLDQLERLLALPGVPDMDQLLRLSTGVRGSAQMAGAETVAGVAERLEDAARSILSNNVAWSEDIRELSRQTVADLKLLVRALNRWGQEEERRVREAILRWDDREDSSAAAPPAQAVPVDALFYDDAGPHVIDGRDAVVGIETLLLRGNRAFEEALALRPRFERLTAGEVQDAPALKELVEELFDLLELSRDSESPEV